jgi:hypothetical protein
VLLGVHVLGKIPLGTIGRQALATPVYAIAGARGYGTAVVVNNLFISDAEKSCVCWENRLYKVQCEPRVAYVKCENRVYERNKEEDCAGPNRRKKEC